MQSTRRSLSLANKLNRRLLSTPVTSHTPKQPSATLRNTLLYTGALTLGSVLGIATGEYLLTDETRPSFVSTRTISSKVGSDFPLKITLYQYQTCLYSTQVRTYLDYFGLGYDLVEVDSASKRSLKEFTNARQLPIVDATAILSALESVRCGNGKEKWGEMLTQYLPVLDGKVSNCQKNPFKYYVHNSDLK